MPADPLILGLTASVALAAGAAGAAALVGRRARRRLDTALAGAQSHLAETQARLDGERQRALAEAEERSAAALREARTALEAARQAGGEREARQVRREQQQEARELALGERERAVARGLDSIEQRETRLRGREDAIAQREQDIDRDAEELARRAAAIEAERERIAGLTPEQARAELLARIDAELATELAARIARHEKDLAARAKELAIEHVSRAIQRYAAEHTAENTSARIHLASEDVKGRIIGREGRNIKAFEQATGVDVIIDEAPDAIAISCFDPVRREIARRALERLLDDGRIHPGRIEEVMAQVQQEMDRELIKLGEDAAYHCEVSGLHPQLIKLLGKLHFRTSYGQNVLKHTQEVAFLCAAMAADLGLDAKLARRCGLLHDIGKAIDHEQEGSHPELGHEALKRYGESEVVANAALAHHEGHAVLSAYTVLAAAADAISAARPGARSQSAENYIKRLTQLETIACTTPGVQKAYAIQAGRELRVLINAHTVPDHEMAKIARDIARRIEDQVAYPGEVRVTLIRETRQQAVAR